MRLSQSLKTIVKNKEYINKNIYYILGEFIEIFMNMITYFNCMLSFFLYKEKNDFIFVFHLLVFKINGYFNHKTILKMHPYPKMITNLKICYYF